MREPEGACSSDWLQLKAASPLRILVVLIQKENARLFQCQYILWIDTINVSKSEKNNVWLH